MKFKIRNCHIVKCKVTVMTNTVASVRYEITNHAVQIYSHIQIISIY